MIFWNFKNPITFLACCLWNFSEYFEIPLNGWLVPKVFGWAIGNKGKNKKDVQRKEN